MVNGKMWFVYILLFVFFLYLLFIIYVNLTNGKCVSKASLEGKTIVVTGADKGIGYETVLDLAGRKAKIIMACRDTENAERVAKEVRATTGNEEIRVKKIDVSSLASVKEFAESFLKEENRLDILINNAGIPSVGKAKLLTSEGFEQVFVTNYLGHFLLTMLLLDTLKRCKPSRIINVSSLAHKMVKSLDGGNLKSDETPVSDFYGRSKLLQILFTKELSRQLEGTGVTVNSLHPGIIRTNIFNKISEPGRTLCNSLAIFFFKTPKEGAQTTIHLAVAEGVEKISGEYFADCKPAKPSKLATDLDLAKKIFEASEACCREYLNK